MTLTRRSTLSLAGGAVAAGAVGYLGWRSSRRSRRARRTRRSRPTRPPTAGGRPRKAERSLGDPAAKVTVRSSSR